MCYTVCRGCSYAAAVYTTLGNVYTLFRISATLYLSISAIYQMLHSPHICLALRCCHILQYSLRFRCIACCCICFAIIVFYRSEIHCPIFTVCSTTPLVLHMLRWFIIGLQCLLLLIPIRIIAIIALIPVDINGSQVKPLKLSRGRSSPAGCGDGIGLVVFIIFIIVIPATPWHHKIKLVLRAIVVCQVVWAELWISAS